MGLGLGFGFGFGLGLGLGLGLAVYNACGGVAGDGHCLECHRGLAAGREGDEGRCEADDIVDSGGDHLARRAAQRHLVHE